MKIIHDRREMTGWIVAIIEDRWVEAKVYDLPSVYGINEGRISKLCIRKTNYYEDNRSFWDQIDYNYDRGLDFHKRTLSKEKLNKIIEALESLPKVH